MYFLRLKPDSTVQRAIQCFKGFHAADERIRLILMRVGGRLHLPFEYITARGASGECEIPLAVMMVAYPVNMTSGPMCFVKANGIN